MVTYIWLMEVVKAELMVPRQTRTPPATATGRQPKRLLSTEASGAEGNKGSRCCGDDVCV